ncbi:MAG: hypothetical protein LUD27_00990 [Clostridia bacterium]|nr:hypothetical protein [Clostridia bacterium]
MRKIIYDNLHKFIALLCVIVICIAAVFGGIVGTAVAYAESTYTDVLTDLQSDESFNVSDYPADSSDYSLSVIQIAESEDNELFLYVYRPYTGSAYDITATSINMSLFEWGTDDTNYFVYSLTLLNEYGVFQKYKVNGFTVSTETTRYYDISAIYRPFNSALDDEQENGNTTDEISFEVGKCWRADTDSSGNVTYTMQKTDVLTITSKRVGYVEYADGFNLYGSWCDSHFVAFDCDYDIDYLYEADVYYVSRSYSYSVGLGLSGDKTYGDEVENYAYLTYTQDVSYTGTGWFAKTYTWDRIEKVSDFIASEEYTLTDDATEDISSMQWVLRFAETSKWASSGYGTYIEYGTDISSVTILRLKFMSNGTTYNLGVVDNRTSGSDEPDGTGSGIAESCENIDWRTILAILALVVIVIILFPVLPYVAQFLVWIISLPFKLINAIIKAFKKPKDKNKRE